MSRIARSAINANCFHVIVQGIAREYIFADSRFKLEYLNDIEMYKSDCGVKILGYCMMDNHAHFLVVAPNVELLGRMMRKVNTRYAQYYNFMNERVGYVFRERYKSQAILDSKYMLNCLNYIHLNPVNAGICENFKTYPYSSYGCYMRGEGMVDFKAAGEFYEPSPENISAIHDELGEDCPIWIESDDDKTRKREADVMRVIKSLTVPARYLKSDKTELRMAVTQLRKIGLTYDEIGEMFDITRYEIRTLLR